MTAPSFWRDRRGGVAVIGAISGTLACLAAAVVVDGGSMALQARRLQGAADLSALAAARDLAHADAAARATARANAGEGVEVVTVVGLYRAEAALAPETRFTPGEANSANAARVTVSGAAPMWFGRLLGRDSVRISRTASAAVRGATPMAMISIGSRLARLDGGLANQVLGGLTGSDISLSVMDYRGLADAEVNLLAFSDALATHLDVEAGDYDTLLSKQIDAGEALRLVETVSNGGEAALDRLARAASGKSLRVGDLIGLETEAPDGLRGGLDAGVSALDLAGAVLEIAGGDRQLALDLGARAGLADVDAWLAIGERPNRSPWLTVTRDGQPVIRTAQARLYVEARTSQNLAGLAQVRLPLLLELASAEARLEDIRCQGGRVVEVGVRPGVARARIGTVDRARLGDFKTPLAVQPAELAKVAGLVTVRGSADIEAADQGFSRLRFEDAAIAAQTPQTVRSRGFTSGVVGSLLGRLSVDVDVAGLGLGLGGLTSALGRLLAPLGPVLDGVVDGLLSALGLSFGEADVTVHQAVCRERGGVPVLVG